MKEIFRTEKDFEGLKTKKKNQMKIKNVEILSAILHTLVSTKKFTNEIIKKQIFLPIK